MRIGQYQRRRQPLIIGLLTLIGGAVIFLTIVFEGESLVNIFPAEPTWLLRWQATGMLKGLQIPSTAELDRRLSTGTLSPSQIDAFAEKILAIQGDPNAGWLGAWGDFIEGANAAGQLSANRWQQYARQAPVFQFAVRPTIRKGDPLPAHTSFAFARTGRDRAGNGPILWAFVGGITFSGPATETLAGGAGVSLDNLNSGRQTGRFEPTTTIWGCLAPGPFLQALPIGLNKVHVTVPISVCTNPNAGIGPIAAFTRDFDVTVNVLPATRPSVTVHHDPSLQTAMQQAVFVHSTELSSAGGTPNLGLQIETRKNPVAISFQVVARAGLQEWNLGTFALSAGTVDNIFLCSQRIPGFHADHIDVILRPDPAPAIKSIDVFDYWDGEIVIKDVPVPFVGRR